MNKIKLVILIALVVVVATLILVYFDTYRAQQTSLDSTKGNTTIAEGADTRDQSAGTVMENNREIDQTSVAPTTSVEFEDEILINREKVDVSYNSPEYELSLELCENSEQKTFLRMKYDLNGSKTVNELSEENCPELAGLFEDRVKEGGNTEAYRIKQALLNPVHAQLYLLIQSAPLGIYMQSSFYMINLKDTSIKKLFSYPGLYGEMAFNKDFSLLAYSFGDSPVISTYQEDNLLEVFDCSSVDYLIKGNITAKGGKLGSNSNPEMLYDYEFEGWITDNVPAGNILKLKQAVRPLDKPNSGLLQSDVLYDMDKNLLLNIDFSEQKLNETISETGSALKADPGGNNKLTDSEPVKVLKSFYSYLGSENDYAKAMLLLDDNFKLRLKMLKSFGVDELIKKDIDEESASGFSEILRSAKFDSVSGETAKDDVSTIKYIHIMGAGTDTEVKRDMTAVLKKTGKAWKILSIEDGLK